MFLLYQSALVLFMPLWLPWMWWRAKRRKEAPNWQERQGSFERVVPRKEKNERRVWIHAVSVGEVIAALPLLRALKDRLPADVKVCLSVTTSTGHEAARTRAEGLYDFLVYMPIDLARFQLRAAQWVRPSVAAIMETELWMGFLWAVKVFDAKTMVVNGRLSDRSFKRSRSLRPYYRALFRDLDRCLVQTESDAARFTALGAHRVEVYGNTKFDEDLARPLRSAEEWRSMLGLDERPVVVVGSTRGDMEQGLVVEALAPLSGKIQVIHAPRHLETAGALERLAIVKFPSVGRRSRGDRADYLILDTIGELSEVYAVADVVIIGGGFDHLGGQNLIQPLAHGKPVIHGPHMFNFRSVAAASLESGASMVASTPAEIRSAVERLLADGELRASMAAAAATLIHQNRGASNRYAQAIVDALR